jgi:hypothetical protein
MLGGEKIFITAATESGGAWCEGFRRMIKSRHPEIELRDGT